MHPPTDADLKSLLHTVQLPGCLFCTLRCAVRAVPCCASVCCGLMCGCCAVCAVRAVLQFAQACITDASDLLGGFLEKLHVVEWLHAFGNRRMSNSCSRGTQCSWS